MLEAGHAAFHESYFEHPCTVMTEQDVLDTDIRGKGWCVSLRRWFHAWFLLSYNDDRCRVYYVSTNAIRLERARHFQQYRGRIHPLSKFSNFWTIFMTIVLIANRSMFHQNTAMFYGKQTAFTITCGIVFEMITIFDLIVNFKTGYTDVVARKVILDASMGYAHYCSTKLLLHVASAMPLQFIMLLRFGIKSCILCKATYFVCAIKVLGLFGLLRLYESTAFLDRKKNSFTKMHICKILRIIVLAILTMLQFIDFIDTIHIMIMLHSQKVPDDSYFSMVLSTKIILYNVPDIFFVCVELSILCKSVLLFGYGMYRHDYYLDKIFSLLCYILSCTFCMWGFIECYAIIHRQKFVIDEALIQRHRTSNWMKSNQLYDSTSEKVNEYYDNFLSRPKVIEKHNDLYKFLPSILIKEINLNAYFSYVRRIPYFSDWPVEVVEELVITLEDDIFLETDVLAHPFTQGEGLVIVFAGVLAVYDVGMKEMGHLIDGDYYGELSLVTDKELRTSSVAAVTVCQILFLSKSAFRKTMRKYSNLFFKLRTELRQKYRVTSNTRDISDLNEDN